MVPILQKVTAAVGDKATIVKIDIDQNRELTSSMNIIGIPTFVLFKNGDIKWKQRGMQSTYALTSVIDSVV